MVNLNGIFDSLFGLIGNITKMIRDLVNSVMPEYSALVLLGLGVLGGYYISKRFPKVEGYYLIALYGLLLFLLLRYV